MIRTHILSELERNVTRSLPADVHDIIACNDLKQKSKQDSR